MSFSSEIQEKIDRFAREESQNYLQDAERTYLEKLHWKATRTKRKAGTKLARLKGQSDKGLEAKNDMVLYITDYMNDLISQGLTEQEAYAKASEEMKSACDAEQAADASERFRQYYAAITPPEHEAIGLFHGGLLLIGMALGGLAGYLLGGGRMAFRGGGWVDTVIGLAAGLVVGLGAGTICHGVIVAKRIHKPGDE